MKKLLLTLTLLTCLTVTKAQQVSFDKFTNINCDYVGGNVLLNWVSTFDVEDEVFLIERSSDGISFKLMGYVNITKIPFNGEGIIYSFVDKNPLSEYSYYRVRSFGTNAVSETKMVFNNYSINLDVVKQTDSTF